MKKTIPKKYQGYYLYQIEIRGVLSRTALRHIRNLMLFDSYAAKNGIDLKNISLQSLIPLFEENKLSINRQRRIFVALNQYNKYLLLRKEIDKNYIEPIKRPVAPLVLYRHLTFEKIDALINTPDTKTLTGLRDHAILMMLYDTGIRNGELCKLTIHDVDFANQTLKVQSKRKERLIPLQETAVTALLNYLKHRSDNNSLLFPHKSKPMTNMKLCNIVKDYSETAGLGNITPHMLRRAFATHLAESGANLRIIQKLLGHTNISTTQIYLQFEHRRLKKLHEECHPRAKLADD